MPMAMTAACGIDWSEDHHDVAVVDADGHLVAILDPALTRTGIALTVGLGSEWSPPACSTGAPPAPPQHHAKRSGEPGAWPTGCHPNDGQA
jgi:hypothetical protein